MQQLCFILIAQNLLSQSGICKSAYEENIYSFYFIFIIPAC